MKKDMNSWLQDVIHYSQTKEEIFYSITDYSMDREIDLGFEELIDIEQKSFLIGKLLLEINNGGFDQYFLNTKGYYAISTLDFLDFIEETNFSKLLNEGISIYKAVIPDDIKLEEFDKLDNQLYSYSNEYDLLYSKFVDYIDSLL